MRDYTHPRIKEAAFELGLRPQSTVLDAAHLMIERGHELLGRPFDRELSSGTEFQLLTPGDEELQYSPCKREYNGSASPTHVEYVELPAWLSDGGRNKNPPFYPQHRLKIERSSNLPPNPHAGQWLNAVSGMDITTTHKTCSQPTTLGLYVIRLFLNPDGSVRNVLGRSTFERGVEVPGLKGGRMGKNEDLLPIDFTLGNIARNELASRYEKLYAGWGFTFTMAHLLDVFRAFDLR